MDTEGRIKVLQSIQSIVGEAECCLLYTSVVEHDEDTMRAADYIVDIGPGAGEHGGQVVAVGTANQKMCIRDRWIPFFMAGMNMAISGLIL